MYQITVKSHFNSAHRLKDYSGDCSNWHGHTFYVEVVIEGSKLDKLNMVMDFKDIKSILKPLIEQLDHHNINEVLGVDNATAEYLAKWFYDRLYLYRPNHIDIVKVTVWESPDCGATYYESV